MRRMVGGFVVGWECTGVVEEEERCGLIGRLQAMLCGRCGRVGRKIEVGRLEAVWTGLRTCCPFLLTSRDGGRKAAFNDDHEALRANLENRFQPALRPHTFMSI